MGFSAAAAIGGMLLSGMMQKTPDVKMPAAPEAPPAAQASKAPDAATAVGNNTGVGQAGGAPGVAQTFLTGAGGVDPKNLNLMKSTLLG